MTQIYFIDGYNVILNSAMWANKPKSDLESARMALIERVIRFCAGTEKQAFLVFDGRAPFTETLLSSSPHANVHIIYSSQKHSADMIIERMLYEKLQEPGEKIVVTNDREVRELCQTLGAIVISIGTFLGMMHDAHTHLREELKRKTQLSQKYKMEDLLNEHSLYRLQRLRTKLEKNSENPIP